MLLLVAVLLLAVFSGMGECNISKGLSSKLSKSTQIIFPSSGATFINDSSRWSDWRNPTAQAIVEVSTEADIEQTVKYAISNRINFLVQNEGHAWQDWSKTQDVILIKTDRISDIVVDPKANTVTLGPGGNMSSVINAIHSYGKQMPTGTCNCVGFLGAALGGGHGRLQGMYGLISDNLLSARVLLASGNIVTASAHENSDLFYALRGAGHNFGIVLRATFRIYDQVPEGLHYDIAMTFNETALWSIFDATNKFTVPAEGSALLAFFTDANGAQNIMLDYTYAGNASVGRATFEKAYGHLAALATSKSEEVYPWTELNENAAFGFTGEPFCHRGGQKNVFSTGLKTSFDEAVTKKLWANYKALVESNNDFATTVLVFESYSLEAVRDRNWDATAYSNRDVRYIVMVGVNYNDVANEGAATAFGSQTTKLLQSRSNFDQPRVYVNYGRGSEDPADFYGHELSRRVKLAGLKKKFDPSGKFNNFHPVPTVA